MPRILTGRYYLANKYVTGSANGYKAIDVRGTQGYLRY